MRSVVVIGLAVLVAACADASGSPFAIAIDAPESVIGQLAMTPHGTLQRVCTVQLTATAAGGRDSDFATWGYASVRVTGPSGDAEEAEWSTLDVGTYWGGATLGRGDVREARWTPPRYAPYRVVMVFHYKVNRRPDVQRAYPVQWRCP